jgi:hypothetical protein
MTRLTLQYALEAYPADSEVEVVLLHDDGTWEMRAVSLVVKAEDADKPVIVPYRTIMQLQEALGSEGEG